MSFAWMKSSGTIASPSLEDSRRELATLLDKYNWFFDCDVENKVIVVYTHIMNIDVLSIVPMVLYGHRVVVRFAEYALCSEKYAANEPQSSEDTWI